MPQPIYQIGAGAEGPWAVNVFHLVSVAGTNPTVVKPGAGFLFGYRISNLASAVLRKVAFHDQSVPPTAGVNVAFSLDIHWQTGGGAATLPETGLFVQSGIVIPFTNGISITTTAGIADSDATPVAAGDLNIFLLFR